MKLYVLGFFFDELVKDLLVIRKKRPEWQSGMLNGLGGKIESGECPEEAMTREFKEECGVEFRDWIYFGEIFGKQLEYKVYLFAGRGSIDPRTTTSEEIKWVSCSEARSDFLSNLKIIIPAAMDVVMGSGEENCILNLDTKPN